jgi:hypothetical protein
MRLYQSKPTTVEAVQYDGTNWTEVAELVTTGKVAIPHGEGSLQIQAGKDGESGWVNVPVGTWVVRKPMDSADVWPCDDPTFRARYDLADD